MLECPQPGAAGKFFAAHSPCLQHAADAGRPIKSSERHLGRRGHRPEVCWAGANPESQIWNLSIGSHGWRRAGPDANPAAHPGQRDDGGAGRGGASELRRCLSAPAHGSASANVYEAKGSGRHSHPARQELTPSGRTARSGVGGERQVRPCLWCVAAGRQGVRWQQRAHERRQK